LFAAGRVWQQGNSASGHTKTCGEYIVIAPSDSAEVEIVTRAGYTELDIVVAAKPIRTATDRSS
jgi:hypothetical protein